MRALYPVLWAALTLLIATHARLASADDPPASAPPPGYQAAVDLGVDELDRGNYAEARTRFLEAHALYPNARTLRALGMAEYELRNYVASCDYLEQALRSRERPLTYEQRQATQVLLNKAYGYVARYTLWLTPAQAVLTLDGAPLALPADRVLRLSVGEHVLEAHAPGYQSERRSVNVIGRVDQTLRIELSPLPAEPAPSVPEAPREASRPRPRRWWPWVAGAGAVATGVLVTALLVRRDPGTAEPSGGTTGIIIAVPRPTSTP